MLIPDSVGCAPRERRNDTNGPNAPNVPKAGRRQRHVKNGQETILRERKSTGCTKHRSGELYSPGGVLAPFY